MKKNILYMADNRSKWPSDLGPTLAKIRNNASLKQGHIEAALEEQDVTLAQSRISRIEKGTVNPLKPEIEAYLSAIGTDEAEDYRQFLVDQSWENLEPPSFWNPQRKDLWEAETCLKKLKRSISAEAPEYIRRQAEMHQERIQQEAEYLGSLKHSIAYVGSIGVGKTTAICHITGLLIPKAKRPALKNALSVAAGRTTVCEVSIKVGPKLGIRIKPQTPEEIDKSVDDLCAKHFSENQEQQDGEQADLVGIVPAEIKRLFLNMADLNEESLSELAKSCQSQNSLVAKFKEKLRLHDRKREEIWFEEENYNWTEMTWLQETFKAINYGNNKEVTVPKQIDVIVPAGVVPDSDFELEIIDTRGLDNEGTTIRRDIIDCLDNSRTLTVLCSKFADAPSSQICDIIDHLINEGSQKVLQERTVILCLPQNAEAEDITNPETGDFVESTKEAYELKKKEVDNKIRPKLKNWDEKDIPVLFFNAQSEEDEPSEIFADLLKKIGELREASCRRLQNATNALLILIQNQEEEDAKKAYEKVKESVKNFLDEYGQQPLKLYTTYRFLLQEIEKSHQKTIRATMRRQGRYDNLDIYLLLGKGAREVAWVATYVIFHRFEGMIDDGLKREPIVKNYAETFLNEILVNWKIWHEDFLRKTEYLGEEIYKMRLISSYLLWWECNECQGRGYKKEVVKKINDWFRKQEDLEKNLNHQIQEAWQEKVLAKLARLIEDEIELAETD
ncbi:helix-turn-helix domain-containing protein [Laspinema sp. D2d]|uniref:helix-turn-helix domain-containing protein n=1 Tax=Laspinema sp. D2d TaxID=2953686 RepID=UPI0021BA7AC2|nr:helix-turn-helix transcriptional regulator [Laspinema sp. D2d]